MGEYNVYMHENKINGKRYIGLTKQIPQKRWGVNGINYKNKNPLFWNAIQKYGWDNFTHIIIASGLTREDAAQYEIQLIRLYHTQDKRFGYNILSGGTCPKIPPVIREKMSKAMLGNKNGLGKPCSPEKARKISEAQKGRKLTEQHKQTLRKPKSITYPCTPEKRQHIIDAKKDKKAILCIETGEDFCSIHECARQMNLSASAICAVLHGRIKSTGGYTFKYL